MISNDVTTLPMGKSHLAVDAVPDTLRDFSQEVLRQIADSVRSAFPRESDACELVLIDVDPQHVHAFWNIPPETAAGVQATLGRSDPPGQLVLRVTDVERGDAPGDVFDIEVIGLQGTQYVDIWGDARRYRATIGFRLGDGELVPLARSGVITLPAAGASADKTWREIALPAPPAAPSRPAPLWPPPVITEPERMATAALAAAESTREGAAPEAPTARLAGRAMTAMEAGAQTVDDATPTADQSLPADAPPPKFAFTVAVPDASPAVPATTRAPSPLADAAGGPEAPHPAAPFPGPPTIAPPVTGGKIATPVEGGEHLPPGPLAVTETMLDLAPATSKSLAAEEEAPVPVEVSVAVLAPDEAQVISTAIVVHERDAVAPLAPFPYYEAGFDAPAAPAEAEAAPAMAAPEASIPQAGGEGEPAATETSSAEGPEPVPLPLENVLTLSSFAVAGGAVEFEINAELHVFGRAKPGMKLQMFGRPVGIRPDGTFSINRPLPNGALVLSVLLAKNGEREE